MIALARQRHPDIKFHEMRAEDIAFDKPFDVIVLSNVVGYFDNVQAVLERLKHICHPRTKIFIQYFSRLWQPILRVGEWLGYKKPAPEQNWLSLADLRNLLYLAGFEDYRATMRMLFPIRIPLVSTLLNRYIAKLPLLNAMCLSQFITARLAPGGDGQTPGEVSTGHVHAKDPSVSIVIPARNESGNIRAALERIPHFGRHTEIIFVEGNSTDDTWETIQQVASDPQWHTEGRTILTTQQDGKGKYDAVKKGFEQASGDILMILDADLTVPPEELPSFYHAIRSRKGEFINGSRLVYPMDDRAMRFLNMLGNKFFSHAFTWLLEQPIKDTLCGTKVMYREDYQRLKANRAYFGDFDPFGDFDLLFGAYKLNLKIIDLPIRYRERTYGDTNISRFYHGAILFKMVGFAIRRIKMI